MGENFGILFVIAIILPVLVSADNITTVKCSDRIPEYKKAGDDFYAEIKNVMGHIQNTETPLNMEMLKNKSETFLSMAKRCTNTNYTATNYTIYIDLIEYSMKNKTILKDLTDQNQWACIYQNMDAISKCTNASRQNSTKYSELWNKSYLTFNDITCPESAKNKKCVVNILNRKCKPVTAAYVSSLFDYILEKHCKSTETPNSSSGMSAFGVAFIVFIVEFTKRYVL